MLVRFNWRVPTISVLLSTLEYVTLASTSWNACFQQGALDKFLIDSVICLCGSKIHWSSNHRSFASLSEIPWFIACCTVNFLKRSYRIVSYRRHNLKALIFRLEASLP